MRARRRTACLTLATSVALTIGAIGGTAAAAPPPAPYEPPVDDAIVDHFRPPATPYGRGNRGVDYDTTPGTRVRAIGDGMVRFAGAVAGARHVTVAHPDGLRSSYSFLASIEVRVGDRVEQGDVVGVAGTRLHVGVRAGDRYLDPEQVFASRARVRLVPLDDGSEPSARDDRAALWLATRSGDGGIGFGDVARWLGRKAAHYVVAKVRPLVVPVLTAARITVASAGALLGTPTPCSAGPPPAQPARGRRIAVLVGGLGSSSTNAAISDLDTAALGYDPDEVVRFSYRGGRVPHTGGAFSVIPQNDYEPADTLGDLRAAGRLLADLLQQLVATSPGVPIDLLAHSQGGIVARAAVAHLAARHALPAEVDLVATIATPHAGAVLAAGVRDANRNPAAGSALEVIGGLLDIDPDAVVLRQLAPGSRLLRSLPPRLPPSVRGLAIAARGDLIVPPRSARLSGARTVVVGVDGVRAHDNVPGNRATTAALARGIAGRPPRCESRFERLTDAVSGELVAGINAEGSALLSRFEFGW